MDCSPTPLLSTLLSKAHSFLQGGLTALPSTRSVTTVELLVEVPALLSVSWHPPLKSALLLLP